MNRAVKTAALTLTAVASLSLTACGNDVEHGTVIDKNHTATSVSVITVPRTTCINKRCTTTSQTQTVVHPEQWVLVLRDDKGDTGSITVDSDEYSRIEIGDQY